MFDSALCDRTLTHLPVSIQWWQFSGFKELLFVIVLLLMFFGLRWVMQHPRWRRQLTRPKALVFLFGLTVALPLILSVAAQGLVVFLPRDSGAATEAIVVLGRGGNLWRQRIELAAELWQAGRAPVIFSSGRGDAPVMNQLLEKEGVPERVLDGENCSLTTEENAIFTGAILRPRGIERILLITDAPHMWRSLLVFRTQGFTVVPHPSQLASKFGLKDKAFLALREYSGLISYSFRGRFQQRRSPHVNDPKLVNLLREAEQYGKERSFPVKAPQQSIQDRVQT